MGVSAANPLPPAIRVEPFTCSNAEEKREQAKAGASDSGALECEGVGRASGRDVSQTMQICAYVLFERGTIKSACGLPAAQYARPNRPVAVDLREYTSAVD